MSQATMIGFVKHFTLSPSTEPLSIIQRRPNSICSSSLISRQSLIHVDQRGLRTLCNATRRRVRHGGAGDGDGAGEEYGRNEEVAMLEMYSQSARGEVLLVKALVDGHEVEVLIFKGFSACLSHGTSPDPSKSVLPARAVIKSIDIVKGPFDPSNIEYLQKGLTWEEFKNSLLPN